MRSTFCEKSSAGFYGAAKSLSTAVLASMILMMASLPALGQTTTGSVSGVVNDPSGATVAGASVTLRHNETGATYNDTSNENGEYSFPQVAPGAYTLTVEASGFKRSVAPDVLVEVGNPARTTMTLEVGAVSEVVTVTAAQEIVNATSPVLTSVINTRQVQDLPLPTRNPLDLAGLQPGVAVVGSGTRTGSISGLRGSATNVTQDGINAMDNFVKTDSLFALSAPSLNSTSEISITTGTVSSDAGRGVGQVRVTTRGGSNDFHGEVFYLIRNDWLEANSFFNNLQGVPRPRENQHFFGFSAGGPVFAPRFGEGGPSLWNGRDRAFWFFSYEGFRETFAQTRTRTVLTPEARQGIFRYVGSNGQVQSVNLLTIGNANAINPITSAQINAMPLPNSTLVGDGLNTSGFAFNVTGTDPSDKFVGRYDHQLVERSPLGSHKLEVVFNKATFSIFPDTFNSLEAPFPGGINAGQDSTRWLITVADHSTFGGNVTNEFRFGRQWSPVGFIRDAAPANPFHIVYASVTNFDNTFMSQGRETTVNQFIDNLAIPKGNHTVRAGMDFQQVVADTFNDAGIHPTVTLGSNSANPNGITTTDFPLLPAGAAGNTLVTRAQNIFADLTGFLGSAAATFNVTSPDSGFVQGATRSRIFRQRDLALYAQDQWRARTNLSINFGVRWDYMGVPTIPNGLAIQVQDPATLFGVSGFGNLFNPNAPAGPAAFTTNNAVLDFVSGDTGRGLYKNDWNNFAPFFGFAYSPGFKGGFLGKFFGGEGTSSIRGGYSISYLHDGFTVISNALGVGTTNPGLIQSAANNTPTGVLGGGGVALATPTFTMPITDRVNNGLNVNNGLWAIDSNLRTPYVQQWSIGYEREVTRNMAFEARYVGNHAIKVWRAVDYNELNIFENGFLQEFVNAQRNLAIHQTAAQCGQAGRPACSFGNSGLPGQVGLPILDRLFFGIAAASGYGSSTFIGNLSNNNVATMANTLAFSSTYRGNRERATFPGALGPGLPANFFAANPNALFARLLTNDSMSNYHSLQLEFRRRFSQGLQFQADYTFSKSMTDARDAQGSQSDLVSYRTLRDPGLDYARSNIDQTHRFVANGIYDLPFGRGRNYWSGANGLVDRLVGGWTVGSILTWQSRPPFFIASNRTTVNQFNAANNPIDLVGMSFEEFKKNVGLYRHPTGVYFINPELLNITTNAAGQFQSSAPKAGLFAVSAPGTFGNFPINALSGPVYFNIDASLVKRIPVSERVKLELKTTFINVLNHANFIYNTQNFDSTSFGRITAQSGSPRVVHFTGKVTW